VRGAPLCRSTNDFRLIRWCPFGAAVVHELHRLLPSPGA
jgi:hypothetical protein